MLKVETVWEGVPKVEKVLNEYSVKVEKVC